MHVVRSSVALLAALVLALAAAPSTTATSAERPDAPADSGSQWKSESPPPMRPDAPDEPEGYGDALPLGSPGLAEERDVTEIAPGLTHTEVVRGAADGTYTVDVEFTTTQQSARELRRDLAEDGYQARVERIARDVPDDDDSREPLGWVVRTGNESDRDEAVSLHGSLVADGYEVDAIRYTGEDGFRTSGPWSVNILEIDPDEFAGTVEPTIADGIVPGLATVPDTADEHDALAAVNAGFFWVAGPDGVDGQLSGITMVDGELVSAQEQVSPNTEYVDYRSSLVFQPDADPMADVQSLGTDLAVEAGEASEELDGLNRKPLDHELVHLTPAFGPDTDPAAATEPSDGIEVVVEDDDTVSEIREERGGPIPEDGSVVVGLGSGEDWLEEHAEVGESLAITHQVTTEAGEELDPDVTGIVNGGPRLVTDGRVDIRALSDGFAATESFFYRWSVNRHPRTVAGVTDDGVVFFFTIDGRQAGESVGASLWEAARVARSLGAEQAINLDGGGSTTMVVEDELLTGQSLRATADALVISAPPE